MVLAFSVVFAIQPGVVLVLGRSSLLSCRIALSVVGRRSGLAVPFSFTVHCIAPDYGLLALSSRFRNLNHSSFCSFCRWRSADSDKIRIRKVMGTLGLCSGRSGWPRLSLVTGLSSRQDLCRSPLRDYGEYCSWCHTGADLNVTKVSCCIVFLCSGSISFGCL